MKCITETAGTHTLLHTPTHSPTVREWIHFTYYPALAFPAKLSILSGAVHLLAQRLEHYNKRKNPISSQSQSHAQNAHNSHHSSKNLHSTRSFPHLFYASSSIVLSHLNSLMCAQLCGTRLVKFDSNSNNNNRFYIIYHIYKNWKRSQVLGYCWVRLGPVLIENPLWHFNCFHYASMPQRSDSCDSCRTFVSISISSGVFKVLICDSIFQGYFAF